MTTTITSAQRSTLTLEGTQISLLRGGSGTPLLFLHGSESYTAWYPFMDELARRHDVIVPDHPGFGASETPPWLDTAGDLAHFYRSFIETLGLRDVVLAGHGIGGWIACELALRNPRDVRALVLADCAGLPLVEDGIDPFMCSPDELRRASYLDLGRAPALDDAQRAQQPKNALMTARIGWRPRFYDPQLAKWLHRLHVPTLVVWGAGDAFFPAAQADVFAAAIPGARKLVIPDAGHLPQLEQPAAFCAGVHSFVDGVRA